MPLSMRKQSSINDRLKRDPAALKLQLKSATNFQNLAHSLIRKLETCKTYSHEELRKYFELQMDKKDLKNLICGALKFDYLFQPIVTSLEEEFNYLSDRYKVEKVLQALLENKFYRNIAKESSAAVIIDSQKSTNANIKVLIACLLAYLSSRLSLKEIEQIAKILYFEEKLCKNSSSGFILDFHAISKILKKLDRAIKPSDFKHFTESLRHQSSSEVSCIQGHQMIYLLNLTKNTHESHSYEFFAIKKTQHSRVYSSLSHFNQSQESSNEHVVNAQSNKRLMTSKGSLKENKAATKSNFRIKSITYHDAKIGKSQLQAFRQIQKNIESSERKLTEKRKSLTLLGRVSSCNESLKFRDSRIRQLFSVQNTSRLGQRDSRVQIFPKEHSKKESLNHQEQHVKPKSGVLSEKEVNIKHKFEKQYKKIEGKINLMAQKHKEFRKKLILSKQGTSENSH